MAKGKHRQDGTRPNQSMFLNKELLELDAATKTVDTVAPSPWARPTSTVVR